MAQTSRQKLFELVCELIGDPPVHIIETSSGWPGVVRVLTGAGAVQAALHVSLVGSHARAIYERRFQNPGDSTPVAAPGGSLPVLVGLATVGVQPVLVVVDGQSRLGRHARFSILFHDSLLSGAARDGWAEYLSSTDERIFAMHPKLLPIFLEALNAGVAIVPEEVVAATVASGIVESDTEEAAERARSFASRLIRDATFSKKVRNAYESRCAMCGLSLELVQGAHILPVSALARLIHDGSDCRLADVA